MAVMLCWILRCGLREIRFSMVAILMEPLRWAWSSTFGSCR
uniref:Uncharacterized protein n=1 Tax=Anguilla anguilla TaxID=7936 RepID=A0A0E9QYZ3_ANGAN